MHRFFLALLAASATLPPTAQSQGISDVMSGIRAGGGWVQIPITKGRGGMKTMSMPTAGLALAGCVNVWSGHSGTWNIRAHERVANQVLDIDAVPGVGVPFAHTFGMLAQVDLDFRWSEPRDTTLLLWIGLELGGEASEESCEPKYEGREPAY